MTPQSVRRIALAVFGLSVLLGLGAPSTPLLVTTRDILVYVDGDRRETASAGARAGNYRLLSTLADGSVLVSYDDGSFTSVESISPSLQPRTVKSLPRAMASFVAPADDGFIVYDGSAQLLRRYDAKGSILGSPAGVLGAQTALGIGADTIVLGYQALSVYDRRASLRHQVIINGGALAPLPGGRFAVTDVANHEVRIYTTALDRVAVLRFAQNRPLGALAAAPDGTLAVVTGTPSCSISDVEVDVFADVTAAQPSARIRAGADAAVGLAVTSDAVYVANAGCRGQNGSIGVFGRDGTSQAVIGNVGSPTGVLPFPAAQRR
ncbi:MAG: hypothetical protein JWM87_382 [Candidatus Eremiobacteraeota bacterium]|nr:hypothetical protein [Candidatus Eremiobacteraeota bacterium]